MTGDTGIHEQVSGDGEGGAINALAIISTELMETIRGAHLALEDCVDGRGGTVALTRTAELLHQACGGDQALPSTIASSAMRTYRPYSIWRK